MRTIVMPPPAIATTHALTNVKRRQAAMFDSALAVSNVMHSHFPTRRSNKCSVVDSVSVIVAVVQLPSAAMAS
jgi:hypothetical protein